MTSMIQVCSNFPWARVFIINTRPDEIVDTHPGSNSIAHQSVRSHQLSEIEPLYAPKLTYLFREVTSVKSNREKPDNVGGAEADVRN